MNKVGCFIKDSGGDGTPAPQDVYHNQIKSMNISI